MLMDTRKKELDWLVTMASTRGWESYAWQKAQRLSRNEYPGIDQELVRTMREIKSTLPQSEAES
jgi:hypothetical protein